MKIPRALANEWRRKLAASGFDDIEVGDGTLLSNKGGEFCAEGRMKGERGVRPFLERAQDAQTARADLEAALENRAGRHHVFESKRDREIWELRRDYVPLRDIAQRLGMTYHEVRKTIERVESNRARKGKRGENKWDVTRIVNRLPPTSLVTLLVALTPPKSLMRGNYSSKSSRAFQSTSRRSKKTSLKTAKPPTARPSDSSPTASFAPR